MPYRVDNIPLYLKPFFLLYSYSLGIILFTLAALLHSLCRIEYEGRENLTGRSNFIFCHWHHSIFPDMVATLRWDRPHIWMNHPAWYMKPIHVWCRLTGVKKLILGSTGHGGQEAAAQLVQVLKEGFSTLVFPDGPAGPPKVLKKGILYMALQSGVPIVPMRIEPSRYFLFKKTWEGKRLPLPFSTIRIIYEKPILVTEGNFEEVLVKLGQMLG